MNLEYVSVENSSYATGVIIYNTIGINTIGISFSPAGLQSYTGQLANVAITDGTTLGDLA